MQAFVIDRTKQKKKSKTQDIVKHLRSKGSITSTEAFELYGATRLSSIIFNLRKKGYDIETEDMIGKDRNGNTSQYAKYVLRNNNGKVS